MKGKKVILTFILHTSYFILYSLSFPATLSAKPCRSYKIDLAQAISHCNWERIEEIEDIAERSQDPCLQEMVEDIKCSFFYSCSRRELDWAYKSCDMGKVLSIRELVETEMTQCSTVFGMREIVMGTKCLYYDRCEKAALKKEIHNCDLDGFTKSIDLLTSELMSDCPSYSKLVESLRWQKKTYFNNCIKPELIAASQNCDFESLKQIEETTKTDFLDSANYDNISFLVAEFKCSHFDICLTSDIENAAENCSIEKVMELEKLVFSDEARQCSFDSGMIDASLVKAKTRYYENCAPKELKEAYVKGDRKLINLILASLVTYPNNDAKGKLLREKAEIFSQVVKKKFSSSMESCDIDAIIETEEYVRQEKDIPNLQQIQEWATAARCGYFVRCVEEDLDQARSSCNLDRIIKIEKEAGKLEGVSGCTDLHAKVREAKCLYFVECMRRDLDMAVKSCNEKKIAEIDNLAGSSIMAECPNSSRFPEPVLEAKRAFFSLCLVKNLYKALDECNLGELLALEKNAYRKLHNDLKYKDIFKVVREIKCSYVGKCMTKEIEFLTHNCDLRRIDEIESMVDDKMGNCPNYGIIRSTVMTAKDKCKQLETVNYP